MEQLIAGQNCALATDVCFFSCSSVSSSAAVAFCLLEDAALWTPLGQGFFQSTSL
jgi:hypothetical protein